MTAQILDIRTGKPVTIRLAHVLAALDAWRPQIGERVVARASLRLGEPVRDWNGTVSTGPINGEWSVELDEMLGRHFAFTVEQLRPMGGRAA